MMVKVLFVDDDEYILTAYQRMLRNTGFDCIFLSTPELIWQQPELDQLDIVVADHHMPGLNGTELLEQLAKRYPKIKRVLISGDLYSACRYQGAMLYHATLEKPCSKASVLQCLTELSGLL
ncbi:MAG TPA: response regulator [Rheinheimera sp.]|uniref:response regulator n=1 Tax=Rheinheimera sp. TaxID=1869214 RepID=UPI002F91F2DC